MTLLAKRKKYFSKVLASPGTLKNNRMGAENDLNFAYFGYFGKIFFFLRNHLHSLENLQKFDYIIAGIE